MIFSDQSFPQNKVTVAELPEGGYCLKLERADGFFSQIGHYATWENAVRVARFNGYMVELDRYAEARQLVFEFALPDYAISA